MNFFRITFLTLMLCLVFPFISSADQLEDANAAISNEDFKKAYELLLPLAEEKNAEALTLLGALYINGQGVEKDFTKGLSLIMNAASRGFNPARIQAFKMCIDLANQGDTAAMYNVGYMCFKDWGGEHDNDVCLRWLENAGKLGHDKSSKILARIYKEGMFDVNPDEEKAAYWSSMAESFALGMDGMWIGSMPGMGGEPVEVSYDFKTNGDELTGTTVGFGGKELDIKDGKIEGNNIFFKVVTKFQGMKNTTKYTGLFLGDTLKLSYVLDMGPGGASSPVTIDLKRAE